MATFSYGGQANFNTIATKAGGQGTMGSIGAQVKVSSAEADAASIGSVAAISTNGLVVSLYDAPSSEVYYGSNSVMSETRVSSTKKGTPFQVGEDITKLVKVDFYRGKVGNSVVFSKVTPPIGATDIVYLGLIPADLEL